MRQVTDGDTLVLQDGRRLRLIGVNTPEISHGGRPGQPLAERAKKLVEDFVRSTPHLQLQLGGEPRDRHGRMLAHVFNDRGENLEERLLQEGFGWHIVIGRNSSAWECLARAEQIARDQGRGVWSRVEYQASSSGTLKQGFQLVRGRVESVNIRRDRSWWVELDVNLSVLIKASEQEAFDVDAIRGLGGREIEVRGWVVERRQDRGNKSKRNKRWLTTVSHPAMIVVLPRK